MTTTTDPRVAGARVDGLLVAGGRSRRFGRDKRRALLEGRTLADIAMSKLRAVVDGDLWVAGAGTFQVSGGAALVDDLDAGAGPLAGIAGGLMRTRRGVLVLPCDAPLITLDTLSAIVRTARRSDAVVALRSARGWEPLVAFYPKSAFPQLAAALREGQRSPHRLLDRLGAIALRVGRTQETWNVNRIEDLAAAAQIAGRA
ncbi:MAG: molybdenum cofactor guanylyltransferase [Deltaproteobacteria bacterium]|nr:molybdenum cofactor guanylyltransferase [Deltaproteobacteria bacterium]